MTQNFTLHSHNNELHFDGRASAAEMIAAAENKGFTTIGVSNHLIMHENLESSLQCEPMFFNNYAQAEDTYKRHIEILQNLKDKFKINIKIGFEVDFFEHPHWRRAFEKMLPNLQVDYLIGASHFLKKDNEGFLCNIYHLKKLPVQPDTETLKLLTINHLKNIEAAIRSGYFRFMAHLDYCTIFDLGIDKEYDDYKWRIIEAIKETKTPFEINTSGYDRIQRPHPAPWMIEELVKNNDIPVICSDDAHAPEQLGRHFAEAEDLLHSLGCTNRLTPEML